MSHLSKNSNDACAMITILCYLAWIWTGISRMHGQRKQCDCIGCKIMENSFSPFLHIDFYYCHCYTTALRGRGFLKICNLRRARMEFHLTFRKNQYMVTLPILMQNKCPKRAGEMAQLEKGFNDKGLGSISDYGHCVPT